MTLAPIFSRTERLQVAAPSPQVTVAALARLCSILLTFLPPHIHLFSRAYDLPKTPVHARHSFVRHHDAPRNIVEKAGIDLSSEAYRLARWEYGFRHAQAYFDRTGNLYATEKHTEPDGYRLGIWIRRQRVKFQQGELSADRIRRLEQIGMAWSVRQRVQTSFNEQALYFYVRQLYPDAENRNRTRLGCELDIYIPSINAAVEYDSLSYHGLKQQNGDLAKNRRCRGNLFLIRVRHAGCPIQGDGDAWIRYLFFDNEQDISSSICALLQLFHIRYGADLSRVSVCLARDSAAISEQMGNLIDFAWNKRYADARDFWMSHHHLDIPYGFCMNGYNLGSWLQDQRKAYNKNQLSAKKIQALEALGIKWNYRDANWFAAYAKVKSYYELHGHTDFSLLRPEEKFLYQWKNDQLKLLRAKRIKEDKASLLAEVGIRSEYAASAAFSRMCDCLRAFRDAHGHSVVPIKYRCEDGTALGEWLKRQRLLYRKGMLPPDRQKALEELGFCPHNYAIRFTRWLELLKIYRRQNGHICVPQSYCMDGMKLGKFINKCRVEYWRGKMPADRVRQLEALGMAWSLLHDPTNSR